MSSERAQVKAREFLAVIGNEKTVTGFLLAGVGHVSNNDTEPNFLICNDNTSSDTLREKFNTFAKKRKDIAIIVITQKYAELIRDTIEAYKELFPALLEIPSEESPYDPEKDTVLKRVRQILGE